MLKSLIQKEDKSVSKTQIEILSDYLENIENKDALLDNDNYEDTQVEFMRLKQEIGFSLLGEMQKKILKDHQSQQKMEFDLVNKQ